MSTSIYAQTKKGEYLVRAHFEALGSINVSPIQFNEAIDSLNFINKRLPRSRRAVVSELIQALEALNMGEVDNSLKICYNLLYGERKLNSDDSLMIYQNLSKIMMDFGDYRGAITHLKKGIEITKRRNYRMNHLYDFISYAFIKMNELDSAITYLKASLSLVNPDEKGVSINAANRYVELGELDLAYTYFQKALKSTIKDTLIDDFMFIYCGIGNVYNARGDLDSALYYYKKSISDTVGMENMYPYVHANYSIAQIYMDREAYDSCTYYMDRFFLCPCLDSESKVWLYKFKVDYYKKIGNKKEQSYYRDLLMSAEDSLISDLSSNLRSLSTLNATRVGLVEENLRVNIINDQIIKERSKLYLMGVILLFISLVLGVIYLVFRIKKNKEIFRIKRQLMESEVIKMKVEKENLLLEVKSKNIGLSKLMTKLSLRKEAMNAQKKVLRDLSLIDNNDTLRKVLLEQVDLIENHQIIDGQIIDLEGSVEELNIKVFLLLKKDYPELTQNDIQICAFHLLGLSTKEIAIIRNVTPKAVQISRYRIKKKLGLNKSIDLMSFLNLKMQQFVE